MGRLQHLQLKRKYRFLKLVLVIVAVFELRSMAVTAFYREPVSPLPDKEVMIVEKEIVVENYILPETTEQKIRAVFGEHGDAAIHVAECESSMGRNPRNKKSSARGVFQVMASVHGVSEKWLLNEDVNIAIAYQLFQEQGWRPWRESNHCHHLL